MYSGNINIQTNVERKRKEKTQMQKNNIEIDPKAIHSTDQQQRFFALLASPSNLPYWLHGDNAIPSYCYSAIGSEGDTMLSPRD
jgi:hypothetical protein